MAARFFYRARNSRGRIVSGHIEADNRGAAVALLRQRRLFVVELRPVPARAAGEGGGTLLRRGVGVKALALFCRQFATMSEAGIPLLQCLHILVQQTEHKALRAILKEVVAEVERGTGLSEAFARFRGRIPELMVNMIAAGEVAGTLDQALHRLAVHFEKEHDLREKIKSAMTYPVLVAGVSVVAMIVLLVVIVPVFTDIFNQMGATLPLPTRMLIAVSNFVKKAWFTLPVLAAALFIGFRAQARTPRGREFIDRLVLRLPIAGPLIHKTILARFARTLATLLRSGVPLLQSIQTVERVVGNVLVARELAEVYRTIKEGGRMAGVLGKSKFFPPMTTSMIAIGEESGMLDILLEKIAAFYEQEVEALVARMSSLIEPLMILGVGAMVGFMALSIYLPLFGMAGAMQAGAVPGGAP